jgi:pyruvate-formate lyase-activating enzyme
MLDFVTLEPAIDPNNRISFLLDWEITMKCNLDCTYCDSGTYGGHDNTTQHPSLEQCMSTVSSMLEYVDLYMQTKKSALKYVTVNIYGGESLHHPHAVTILQEVHREYQSKYRDSWNLTLTTTTNAVISAKKLAKIIPLIDEFSCSYHTENTAKQKQQFFDNVLAIQQAGKKIKCVILMHSEQQLFEDAQAAMAWCDAHGIKYLQRQLDHGTQEVRNIDGQLVVNKKDTDFNYSQQQVVWFDKMYRDRSHNAEVTVNYREVDGKFNLHKTGRACCGGRQLCKDGDFRARNSFVGNKFTGWSCSVNHFFLYIKQITGEIFVNKDCKMDFTGKRAPVGYLNNFAELIEYTRQGLKNNTLPVIVCSNARCLCGLCAPKAQTGIELTSIMKKYQL